MHGATHAHKPTILCVDDEPFVLEGLKDSLRRNFNVQVASSGREGLAVLKANPRTFSVVISDMRMPEMPGSVFLREAKRVAPLAVRMLLTGYSDAEAAIKAVNDGQIFRFLTKPCDRDELRQACAGALWQHRLQKTERDLLEQTLHGAVKALVDVLALAAPAVFGRGARRKELVAARAAATGWADAWEIEVAAMLAQVGAVTLPAATAEKLYAGERLTPAELEMVARIPAITQGLLGDIPRLDGVLGILEHHSRRFDSIESDGKLPVGARMLRIAIDFLELESTLRVPALAIGTMRGRTGVYDPDLLESFALTVGVDPGGRVTEIALRDLHAGMTLADDARCTIGQLLGPRPPGDAGARGAAAQPSGGLRPRAAERDGGRVSPKSAIAATGALALAVAATQSSLPAFAPVVCAASVFGLVAVIVGTRRHHRAGLLWRALTIALALNVVATFVSFAPVLAGGDLRLSQPSFPDGAWLLVELALAGRSPSRSSAVSAR